MSLITLISYESVTNTTSHLYLNFSDTQNRFVGDLLVIEFLTTFGIYIDNYNTTSSSHLPVFDVLRYLLLHVMSAQFVQIFYNVIVNI